MVARYFKTLMILCLAAVCHNEAAENDPQNIRKLLLSSFVNGYND